MSKGRNPSLFFVVLTGKKPFLCEVCERRIFVMKKEKDRNSKCYLGLTHSFVEE